MIESILVPADGSPSAEAALTMAARIASGQICLILVKPDTTELAEACHAARDGQAYLEEIAAPLRRQGRAVETGVVFGDPGRQIVALSAMNDLVVMGNCGATNALLLGSVASWVATHAPVPVMIVRGGDRPAAAAAIDRVVVALDGSPRAESALPVAEKVATVLGLPIHLVRVLDFDPIRAVVQAGTKAAEAWSMSMEETIQQAQDYLASHARQLQDRGFTVSYELRKGLAVGQLLEVLREADIVVVTTRNRGEFTRWLLGSVTDELIRHAPCPVLLTRTTSGGQPRRGRVPVATALAVERKPTTKLGTPP